MWYRSGNNSLDSDADLDKGENPGFSLNITKIIIIKSGMFWRLTLSMSVSNFLHLD